MKVAYLVRVRPELEEMIPDDVEGVVLQAGPGGRYSDADLARVADAEAFVISQEPVHEQILAAAPKLRIVQRLGVGYDTLDLEACARRQIPACNIEGVNKEAVAEHGMALMLALAKQLREADRLTHERDWAGSRLLTASSFELYGKTLGIVGLGNTGACLARRARAFDMEIIYNDVRDIDTSVTGPIDARPVGAAELFERADVVSVNTDLNDTSRGLVDAAMIARMQPHALLICCARGNIVDEAALAAALHEGRLAGAGIDVFATEPIEAGNPLLDAPNCILSSHVAGVASETTQRIWDWAHDNVRAVLLRGERPRWIRNGVGG